MPLNFPDMETKGPENEMKYVVLRKDGQQNKSSMRTSLFHGSFPLENIQEWDLESACTREIHGGDWQAKH